MANRDLTPRSPGYGSRGTGLSTYGGRDPFGLFRREMDRLFEDFFTPMETRSFAAGAAAPMALGGSWPSIELEDRDDAYVVRAEAPGVDPKDIELNLRDNALVISGEKRSERNEDQEGRRYSERSFGRFERTIPLESEVDADKVEATCSNGVLTITLPKNARAKDRSRRIEIKPDGRGAGDGGSTTQPGSGGL
ncbi:MAG: Hsp20/alpha crystallin family protein [Alphaproteobacteria bacterium]|nr:Hsp20/alpha crystallin family protein [Alphaproteobacteria bacterium]